MLIQTGIANNLFQRRRRSVSVKRPCRSSLPSPLTEPMRREFESRPGLKLFYIYRGYIRDSTVFHCVFSMMLKCSESPQLPQKFNTPVSVIQHPSSVRLHH